MAIHYLQETELGIELIVCRESALSYPVHNHVSVFTAGVVLEGAVALTVRNQTGRYRRNQAFAIPPYVPHRMTACGNYTLLTCCIRTGALASAPVRVLNRGIAALLGRAEAYGAFSREQAALLTEALGSMEASPAVNLQFQGLIGQLVRFPERRTSIDDMARAAFMSKYHFIRRFKTEVGLTPHQFLLQNRIRKAQRLLHESAVMAEVALTAGFCDQSHFIRQFERIVGLTPAAYKTAWVPVRLEAADQRSAGMNLANR